MAITKANSKNIRAHYTLGAAAMTAAALALTGCGQLAATDESSNTTVTSTEGEFSAVAAVAKRSNLDKQRPVQAQADTTDQTAPATAEPSVAQPVPAVKEPAPSPSTSTTTSTEPVPATSTATAEVGSQSATVKPAAANTGVPAGITLKPYNTSGADLVITVDGTVLDGLEIYGDIKVRAKNVTIKNSRLHGGGHNPTNATGIVDANSSAVSNLVVENSTIIPDRPSYNRDGIVGHDYTALRNHIQRTNDGLGIFNRPGGPVTANVTAKGNYIHSLTYFSEDIVHSDGTHNDGIQVQGGENILISGNTVVASAVTGAGSDPNPRGTHAGIGIMLQQNVAKLANVVVENNWVDDGQTSINIDNGKYSNITVTVRNNLLGRNQYQYPNGTYAIRIIKRSASTVYGLDTNRWEDSLAFLTEGYKTGIMYNS